MMKKIKFFQISLFLCIAGLTSVNAQVHIGDNADPHVGAVLDLTNNRNLGLKLPVVTLQNDKYLQVDGKPDTDEDLSAIGMTVYNTNKFALNGVGIYVWDGSRWNGISAQGKADDTVIPAPACSQGEIPSVAFAPYNLGADAAKIDGIAAANNISKTKAYIKCSVDDWNAVIGDLYQWGRIADGHEKRSNSSTEDVSGATYDANGQVTDATHKGKFITNSSSYPHDWRQTQKDNLWGNGVGINVSTPTGVPYNGDYYQSTKWEIPANNPCPAGFRVPTQDEWERIFEYDCDPTVASGYEINISSNFHNMTKTGLTWVRVKEGKASAESWSTGDKTGWAIYKTTDWSAAAVNYQDGTDFLYAAAAPEPMLFLPAAGCRDHILGKASGDDSYYGRYWSSTVNGNYGRDMRFGYDIVMVTYSTYRAYGFSVRCLSEL